MDLKKEKLDIIVLAGQSNAEGCGRGEVSEEFVPDERILLLNDEARPRFENENGKDVFKLDDSGTMHVGVAEEPEDCLGKRGVFALGFAKHYVKNDLAAGRKALIVYAPAGGTGFARNEWGKDGCLYRRLCRMTDYALSLNPENRIVAFLWHQGECDSVENVQFTPAERRVYYREKLSCMLEDFKQKYGLKNLPFIAAGFCDEWYLQNKEPCDAVLAGTKDVCAAEKGAFVETGGLLSNNRKTGNGDNIHFCRESQHILGDKYYEAYKKIAKA